jgi:predicted aspartyl protease/Flp pilus assembly protein TadD
MIRRLALAMLGGWLAAGSVTAGECKLSKIADLPITMRGTEPIVTARINGQDVPFLADSGAFFSTLTPAKAKELGLNVSSATFGLRISGVGGESEAGLTTVKAFGIAGATLPNVEFVVAGNALGGETAGLLGRNFLDFADAEYDLAGGVIRLWRFRGCGSRIPTYWRRPDQTVSMVDIRSLNNNPNDRAAVGAAFVNSAKISVLFDTGASASGLSLAVAKRLGLAVNGPGAVSAGETYGMGKRLAHTWIVPVASFKVGDEEIRNTRLRVYDSTLTDVDMLIGADFFLAHRVFIDNTAHKLYFTYNGGPVFNLDVKPSLSTTGAGSEPTDLPAAADSKDADEVARRGEALASRHDFAAAIADLTRAVSLAPANSRYRAQRGAIYAQNNQPSLAMADFDKVLEISPNDTATRILRARLRLDAKDKAGAFADLEALDRVADPQADVRLQMGQLYEHAEAFPQALGQFDLWIKTHPDDVTRAGALSGRCGDRAVLNQDLTKAMSDCEAALRIAPRDSAILTSRGFVSLRLGNLDKAIADFDAALAHSPRMAWTLYGRGLAKARKGQTAGADLDLAEAKAIRPDLPDVAKRYGLVRN